MIETLLGGVFGGVLRLAPEVLKLLDKRDERKHEALLLDKELEFAKTKAEAAIRAADAQVDSATLATLSAAYTEQGQTSQYAGKLAATISALVRPSVTYIFLLIYVLAKIASYTLAYTQGGQWEAVLLAMWSKDDIAVLNMILSFWFVGRVYERSYK